MSTPYAKDAGFKPITACQRVLKRTCDAVALTLDTAEGLAGKGGGLCNRSMSSSCHWVALLAGRVRLICRRFTSL